MGKEKQIEEMSNEIREAVNGCSSYWSGLIAEHLYEQGYRKQEWISVEERLPELYTYVITYDTVSGDVQIDSVLSNGEFVIGYNVTHWMPLPEAPNMKGGE